jgi:hypothetical protein
VHLLNGQNVRNLVSVLGFDVCLNIVRIILSPQLSTTPHNDHRQNKLPGCFPLTFSNMDPDDQGHRYGNFPNYYSFHPPKNRLDVLEEKGILNYIRSGLLNDVDVRTPLKLKGGEAAGESVGGEVSVADDDNCIERMQKKPRLENDSSADTSGSPSKAIGDDTIYSHHTSPTSIFYCDLGCNEGDLTVSMALSLMNSGKDTGDKVNSTGSSTKGCTNTSTSLSIGARRVRCLGLDLDPILIERANTKYSLSDSSSNGTKEGEAGDTIPCKRVAFTFRVANLCSKAEHNSACSEFMNAQLIKAEAATELHQIFNLTSIFSTTMWIHVHSGDEGLRLFLERACSWTKRFLLVEPQPSGW